MDVLGILGAIGGAGGLGWIAEKLRWLYKWAYKRPHLHVCFSPSETGKVHQTTFPIRFKGEHVATDTRDLRWYHLHVRNTGRGTAVGCKGTVEMLEVFRDGQWQRHKEAFTIRIPLMWAHSGGEQRKDIEPRDEPPWDRLDLLTVELGQTLFQVVTPYASGRGVQTGFRVNEPYRFTVSVEDDLGRTSAEAQVTVEPARDAEGELEETPIEVTGHPSC